MIGSLAAAFPAGTSAQDADDGSNRLLVIVVLVLLALAAVAVVYVLVRRARIAAGTLHARPRSRRGG